MAASHPNQSEADGAAECRPPFAYSPAVCSSACSRVMSHEEYLRKHSIPLYMKDALVLLMASSEEQQAAPVDFFAGYFASACAGMHVTGRSYAFVSGSLFNRLHFVRNAVSAFEHMDALIRGVKLMDCHSLMLMLCPDFPLNVVRSAFKPAAFLSQGLTHLEDVETSVPVLDFLKCLGITFVYERFLVEMRHDAFDARSKYHVHLSAVKEVMAEVRLLVEEAGWTSPPGAIMLPLLDAADDAKQCVSFDMLVRAMCGSDELWASIGAEGERLAGAGRLAATMVAAAAEARASPPEPLPPGVRQPAAPPVPSYFLTKPAPRKRSSSKRPGAPAAAQPQVTAPAAEDSSAS
eukprot:jgi/Tetstr1/442551/TSEL_030649.t1